MFTSLSFFLADPGNPVFLPESDPATRLLVTVAYLIAGILVVITAALITYLLFRAPKEQVDRRAKQVAVLLVSTVILITGTTLLDTSQQELLAADQQRLRTWLDIHYPQFDFTGSDTARLLTGKTVYHEDRDLTWELTPVGNDIPGFNLTVTPNSQQ